LDASSNFSLLATNSLFIIVYQQRVYCLLYNVPCPPVDISLVIRTVLCAVLCTTIMQKCALIQAVCACN